MTRGKQHTMFTKATFHTFEPPQLAIAYDKTMKQIMEDNDPDKKFDEKLAVVFHKYCDILDVSYHLLLSESKDLEKLIQSAPGFLVNQGSIPIPAAARLFDIDETSFLDLLERNQHFVDFRNLEDHASPGIMLNIHLRKFLCDSNRSLRHYHNPRPHHLAICLKYYQLTFNCPWSGTEGP